METKESVAEKTRKTWSFLLRHAEDGPRLTSAIDSVAYYEDVRKLIPFRSNTRCPCNVVITDQDPIDATWDCISNGLRPALHVPAHLDMPGGRWWLEDADSETDACLRSTLVPSLQDKWNFDKDREFKYPLSPMSLLYSPDVYFFSDENGQPYKPNRQLWIPVFSSGLHPLESLPFSKVDRRIIQVLYEGLFFMAEQYQHSALVLHGLVGLDDGLDYPLDEVITGLVDALEYCDLRQVVVCIPHWGENQRDQLIYKLEM